jgi:hypothetical protein
MAGMNLQWEISNAPPTAQALTPPLYGNSEIGRICQMLWIVGSRKKGIRLTNL